MQFQNKPNIPHELKDGSILWHSRSCAVTSTITVIHQDQIWIPLNKRGPDTPDYQGHWCLSCGYIDWNENGYDACRREIWEELGLNVLELDIDSDGQPWYVNTEPGNNSRENISLHYWWYRLKPFDILPELSGDNCEPGEVEDVRWFPLDEAMRLDLAFTHNDILKRWKAKFSKYLAHFVEAGDFGDTNERK